MPRLRRPSRMCGTAAAASSRSTVMRTISDPARDSAATCAIVPSTSAVSVLVIDCTTIGAPPPTATLPTMTWVVLCRARGPATSSCGIISGLFMGPRISGFDDIHQEGGEGAVRLVTQGFLRCIFNSLGQRLRPKARQKTFVFRYPLYWTGIAELKGRARFPAAFSWPDAGPSIGQNNGRANNVEA